MNRCVSESQRGQLSAAVRLGRRLLNDKFLKRMARPWKAPPELGASAQVSGAPAPQACWALMLRVSSSVHVSVLALGELHEGQLQHCRGSLGSDSRGCGWAVPSLHLPDTGGFVLRTAEPPRLPWPVLS